MKLSRRILIASQIVSSLACADLSIGDTLVFNAGYGNSIGMSGGSTQATEVIDSIYTTGDTTTYMFSIVSVSTGGFFEDPSQHMIPLIRDTKTILVIVNSIPSDVRTYSKELKDSKWIVSEKSTLLFYKSILPVSKYMPIPILDSTIDNQSVIDYTVRISDTMGVAWRNTETNKTSFHSELIHYTNVSDTAGKIINDSNSIFACDDVPYWSSSQAANPLNFTGINVSSSVYLLNQNAMDMGAGCYRMTLFYYKQFHNPASIHTRKLAASMDQLHGKRLKYSPNGTSIGLNKGNSRLRICIEGMNSAVKIESK